MFHPIAKSADNNPSCSENVAYDTIDSTIKISTPDNMTCSKNVAYVTAKQINQNDVRAYPTSNTPVYDEVSLRK